MGSVGSKRERKGYYIAARPRGHDPGIASIPPSGPETKRSPATAIEQTSSTTKEKRQARAGNHANETDVPGRVPTAKPEHRGHDYHQIHTHDHARVQLGDTYVAQQNVFPNSGKETIKTKKQMFMTDLGFNLMDSRLATIGAAHVDTCRWLFTNKNYLRWRDRRFRSHHHGFLWIKGKPGAGKSTLMKHALQYMQSHNRDDSTVISYFFNARGHGLEKTTEGMYRSLLHQVFTRCPRRLPKPLPVYSHEWKTEGWPIPILQNWLRKAVLEFGNKRKFILYIDALDECDEDSIRLAIEDLEELGNLARSRGVVLSVCFASRHYPRISIKHCETINLDVETEHQNDIVAFVMRKLQGERRLRCELGDEVAQRSSGVFLWAALVVRILNEKMDRGATRSQLLAELVRVPAGIENLLGNIVVGQDPALLPTLQWVLFSIGHLDVEELYFAIKTSIGHLCVSLQHEAETSEDQMRTFILTSSKGLVEFTSGGYSSTAQFIHETVREYFLSGGLSALDHSLSSDVEALSHTRIGQWCHEYITTSIDLRSRSWIYFGSYAKRKMLAHMEIAHSGETLDLASLDSIPQSTWIRLCQDVDGPRGASNLFASYSPSMGGLYGKSPDVRPEHITPLYAIIRHDRMKLAEAFLRRQLAFSDLFCDHDQMATCKRATCKMAKPASLPTVDVNAICSDSLDGTALLSVIPGRKMDATVRVVELLLRCGADPNLAVRPGHTPLLAALNYERRCQDKSLVDLLLLHGADPNIRSNQLEQSAMAVAVLLDDQGLVESLLDLGANIRDQSLTKPLCLAAANSSPTIVRLLLAAGADVDDRTADGRTALHESIMRRGEKHVRAAIAQALLDAGADVDALDNGPDTALTLAFRHKKYGLAKLFLGRGADPNLPQHRDIIGKLSTLKKKGPNRDLVDYATSVESFVVNAPESLHDWQALGDSDS